MNNPNPYGDIGWYADSGTAELRINNVSTFRSTCDDNPAPAVHI